MCVNIFLCVSNKAHMDSSFYKKQTNPREEPQMSKETEK